MVYPDKAELPKIVFVDDEEMLGLAAEIMMMGQPYDLVTFTRGTEALKYLAEDKDVALILIDYMMPEMSGDSLLRELRKNPEYDHIIAIIQSGLASQEVMDEISNANAQGYILKPYSKEALLSLIAKHLRSA